MKKLQILLSLALISTLVMAGGDLVPATVPVAPIVEKCKTDTTYVQRNNKLMWQDMSYTDNEEGAYKRGKTSGKTGSAIHAKNYCKNLRYAGFNDWRVPTSDELMKVYYLMEGYISNHDTRKAFKNDQEGDFWSSTLATEGKQYAIYSKEGFRYEKKTSTKLYVRCVRCID